ncbi:hypothetical protein DFJ73DRAFT_965815 [Zopfochytrium polystomum]|nr:hypothetical protein DFJ73DRAFT_965815 [Zopfochytrium polystomum]
MSKEALFVPVSSLFSLSLCLSVSLSLPSPIAAACFPEAVGVHKTERKYPTKGRTYCCASNAWGGGAQQQGQTEEVTRCRWLFRRKRQSHHTRHRWAIGVNGWMEGQRPRARKSVSFASFGWWRTHGAPHPGWGWLAFREKERGRVCLSSQAGDAARLLLRQLAGRQQRERRELIGLRPCAAKSRKNKSSKGIIILFPPSSDYPAST